MDVKLPNLGDGVSAATVLSVLVSVGDIIAVDQPIVELETDKAVASIPSPHSGKVQAILVKSGDTVRTGTLVLTLEGASKTELSSDTPKAAAPVAPKAPASGQPSVSAGSAPVYTPASGGTVAPASPAIRRMAVLTGLDLARVEATGRGGRIEWEDVQRYVTWLQHAAFQAPQAGASTGAPVAAASPFPLVELEDMSKYGPVRREKVSSLRQKIGKKMWESWVTVPHVTQFDEADLSNLMALREKMNKKLKSKGVKLTVTALIVKALTQSLKAFPVFNSSYDAATGELIFKSYYHIGVAVDTPSGLMVPVIRDVDQKDVAAVGAELGQLAEKARNRQVSLDDLKGGTFTVSNLGGLGVGPFTPIINVPEVAILALSKTVMKPVIENGKLAEKPMLPLGLSYDHRVIDGADGARFIRHLVDGLQSISEADLEG